MSDFFDRVAAEDAVDIERLSRLLYELRENRRRLLAPYLVTDEAMLLEQIAQAAVAEHPAYEHYLGARVLAQSCAAVRAELMQLTRSAQQS